MVVLVTVRVVMVVLADVDPLETVMDEGTGTALLVLVSFTLAPPDGADELSFTVNVTCVDPPTEEDENESWLKPVVCAGEMVSEVDALLLPIDAVMIAVLVLETLVVVTVKLAEVDPEPTVTCAGTLADELLEESETVTPFAPAACDSVTVAVELAPPVTDVGFRTTLATVGAAGG